jgi:hypothetical protein
MRAIPKNDPQADPTAAFERLLGKLLEVTHDDIREALAKRTPREKQGHSENDPLCRSRTDTPG